jgi:hypothetical protein
MTRSNEDDSEDTGRGFFRQVGDALTGIVPGVAYMGRDLVMGGLAPVRATRDFVTGKTSGTDAILGGLPFVDQALDLLGNDAAERRQQQYKPFAAGLDQSVKATGTRLRNPTQYRKAWRDGRIVDVILEDAGNLAGAGSLASKGLTAGARTASLGADAAVAGGNAAQAARMAARADRFAKAAGRAERVATLGNKVSDSPIRVSTSLARRGLRGLGTGIDSTLAAMRNSGENSRPQRAAAWADRRFPTMSTPEGRAVTREGRRVNVTEKRRRSGAIRNILNAAPDELTVPEQGVATALRAGTIDQLIRAADTEVPFTAEGIPAEMGVGIPARPDATSLGRDAARTVVAPRQIPEVTLTGDVAELAAAYRDGTMPAEQRARIDKYAEVLDENLADIQERALVGQGRTKGGLDPQQLGDVAIPEYVDKAIRKDNPRAAGLGLLIDDRWVPYEQLKELADVDQGVADLVDTTMQRDGLAGFVYPSDMDAFNQALNSPNVYPAAWRPQIEMANRARAGVLESSLKPIMDRIAALKDMMTERAALRNAARQELAALRNRVTAEVDDAIAQVGDPELLQIHSDLNAVNRELRGLRAQFREVVGTRRNNDKLLNIAERRENAPSLEGPQPGKYFHGSSSELVQFQDWQSRGANNLFGPGVYTTDTPSVAGEYTKKGSGTTPNVYRVEWAGDNPPRVLDLTVQQDAMHQAIGDQYEALDDAGSWFDPEADAWNELGDALNDPAVTAENLYSKFRHAVATARLSLSDANEVMGAVTDSLMGQGFDALSHRGGLRVGGAGEHNVTIFLDQSKATIVDNVTGRINPKMSRPGDAATVTEKGEQVASGQGRIDSVRTDIAIAEARRDALLDERNARLDAEQEARVADLEDQVDAIDEANGEAPAPKPKRRKRTTDEKNQIEALRLRQRVLDNIGRSQTVRLGRLGATVTNVTRAATPDIAAAIPNTPSDMLAAGLPKPGYVPAGVSDLIDPKRVGTGRRPDRYGIPGIRKPRSENMRASSEELPYSARGMADLIGQEAGQTAANMDVHRIFSDGRLRNVGQILGQTAADLRAKADAEAQAQGGTPAQIAERAKVLYGRAVTEALAEQGFEPLIGDRLAPQHGDFNPDKKIEFDQVGDETVVLPAGLRERLIPYMTGKEMGPFMNTLERLNGKIKGVLLPFSVKWYMGDLVGGAFMGWVGGGIPPNQLFDGMQKIGDLSEEGTRAIFDHPDFQDAGLNFEESARMRNLTERPEASSRLGKAWYRAGDVRRASYRLNGSINRINRQGYVLAKLQQLLDERGLDLDLGDVDRAEWQRPGIQAAITDAVEDANKIMGTFDDMTPFERRYIRNIFPFYAWNRHITKLAWRTAIDNPARMVWTMRIGTYGQDPNDPMNDLPWLRGGLAFGSKIMPTNFINPFNDIAGGSIYTPGGALKATSPALKMLALGVGRDPNNELAPVTRPYDGKGLGPTGKDGGFRPLTPAEFGYNALRQFAPGRALFNVLPTNEIAGVGLGPHPRYGSGALIVDKRGRPIDQSSRWQSLYGLVSAGGTDGAIPFITDREDIEPILAARAKRLEEAQRRASNTIRYQP